MEATELFVKFLVPHGGGYLRQRGLQRSSYSKSRLTASLTRSLREEVSKTSLFLLQCPSLTTHDVRISLRSARPCAT